jgi:prepilin-type N-terminal cleavage/methylation domain-containing protein
MRHAHKNGFTLLELLVVISIIGTLASVVLASLNTSREKAQYAAARTEMRQISQAVVAAQIESNQTIIQMTGSGCSGCSCRDSSGGVESSGCINNWQTARTAISAIDSLSNINGFDTDPWGSSYMLDENEGEFSSNPCRRDILRSAGADRMSPSGDDLAIYLPFNSSQCF